MTKEYPTNIPDMYMQGWDKHYKNQMDHPMEDLPGHYVHYGLQELFFFTYGEKKEEKTALDLATGDGRYACFLAQMGYNVTAIDILPSSVEITKKRSKALGLEGKMEIIEEDIEKFKFKKNSYDVISAIQCLQYLFEKAESKFIQLLNAVKPGGWIVYGGNVRPHFKTEPPIHFITMDRIRQLLKRWTIYSLAREERIIRPGDKRGYIWVVAKKSEM